MENKQINNELLNIMGARRSKSTTRINVVLVQGNKADNSVHYFTCSLNPAHVGGAAECKVLKDKKTGEEYCFIKVKMLQPRETKPVEEPKAKDAKVKSDEMPF